MFKDKNSPNELRDLARWLILALVALLILFGCGQLALLGGSHPAAADTSSKLGTDYGPWPFTVIRAVRADILDEINRDQGVELRIVPDSFWPTLPPAVDGPTVTPTAPALSGVEGTPSHTATPGATSTASPTPASTRSASPTPTASAPTATRTPTVPPTPSHTPTDTSPPTSVPSDTPQPSPTPAPVYTSTPTTTPTPSLTPTPSNTSTLTPTPSNTVTPTPTPSNTATLTPMQVSPGVDCIIDNGDGTFVAFFGYDNPNAFAVTIPVGPSNYFLPSPNDRGQPTTFQPGNYPIVFSVNSSGTALVWHLDGGTATASLGTTPCPATPTPTATPISTPTDTPTITPTPSPSPTVTSTPTPSPSSTPTFTPTPSQTPTPTP